MVCQTSTSIILTGLGELRNAGTGSKSVDHERAEDMCLQAARNEGAYGAGQEEIGRKTSAFDTFPLFFDLTRSKRLAASSLRWGSTH